MGRKKRRSREVWMRSKDGGAVLRRKRLRLHLTQRQLGFISGCSHAFIGQLERDESTVSPELAAQIAFRLQVDVEDIFVEHHLPIVAAMTTAIAGTGHTTERPAGAFGQASVTGEVA